MKRRIAGSFVGAMLLGAAAAEAEVPRVVADIAPVHSLVSQVMGELGTPDLLVPPGASPHSYAMRPSEARALSEAGLVFWMGEDLEPWLEGPIRTLAHGARVQEMADMEGTVLLPVREDAVFAADDRAAGPAAEGDDAHADEADHDEHAHAHDHHGMDPHSWLDPENGRVWLSAIAEALAEMDPANAAAYRANAAAARAALETLTADIAAELAPVRDMRFVVLHDAYQYFESRFSLHPVGAISQSDARDPSAARVAALRDEMHRQGISCILSQPQLNASLVAAVTEGAEVGLAELDPIGVGLEPGPGLYGALLRGLSDGLRNCK